MPGWLSWLERTAHRVIKQCSDLFLGYREIAGSNPAPGILYPRNFHLNTIFQNLFSKHNNFIVLLINISMLS